MNPSDKVDDLLAKAGSQWRAGQPSAPEPDLDRITDQTGRRPRYWAPVLAAASVLVIAATAALVVLPGKEKPTADPVQTLATGNGMDQARLLVRNGDRVEVDGQVIAAPGKPVLYCAPHSQPAIGYLPGMEPAPACPAGLEVKLTGVDLDRLSSPSTVKRVRTGQAHLTGIWTDRAIAVQNQSAPRSGTPDYWLPQVPCKEPPGGWKLGNVNEPISPAVTAFVNARLDQLAEPWIGAGVRSRIWRATVAYLAQQADLVGNGMQGIKVAVGATHHEGAFYRIDGHRGDSCRPGLVQTSVGEPAGKAGPPQTEEMSAGAPDDLGVIGKLDGDRRDGTAGNPS
jgi:hypothetical protein